MAILALLLLLLLGIVSVGTGSADSTSESQTCVTASGGIERCSPTTTDGEYALPPSGTVIDAIVNNGPLPPEYQEGYEITVDATGRATAIVTPQGASEALGDQRTAEPITVTVELGTDGLQQLLHDVDATGFFLLPTREEIEQGDIPVGGDVSVLEVTLADGTWNITGGGLQFEDRERLDEAQRIIALAVGLDPDNPAGANV